MEDDDPLRGEEERHIDRALKHCKQLEHTLRLSLVQVKLLNRKYCAPLEESYCTTPKTTQNIRMSCSESRLAGPQTHALRISRSSPEFGQRIRPAPVFRIYRPLNDILLQSNEIHVQLIKIRRQFEGCLLRVEFLVRTYCKKRDSGMLCSRRWSANYIGPAIGASTRSQAVEQRPVLRRRHSDVLNFHGKCCAGARVACKCNN